MARDVEEKLRKLAAVRPREAERAWLQYLSGEGSERETTEELLDILLFHTIRKDYHQQILLDPQRASECTGKYELGSVQYPAGQPYGPFGLREDEWTKHVLIVGMTGTGKTNLTFQILREFRRHNKPFLVFDWKRNYRDLLQLSSFQDLLVFTVAREVSPFRFNPLIPPPGVEAGEWLMKLVDVLKHAYFVGEGVEYLLRRGMDYVYEVCGYHDSTRKDVPRFLDVRAFVLGQKLQGRMSLWKASALRVLESLCFRHGLGPVVNSPKTWDHQRLLQRGIVLELDTLADADKVFLTEALILWLYEYRKRHGKRETFLCRFSRNGRASAPR